jgi:hypothetical protein
MAQENGTDPGKGSGILWIGHAVVPVLQLVVEMEWKHATSKDVGE